MKKALILILTFSLLFTYGCTKLENSKQSSNPSNNQMPIQGSSGTNKPEAEGDSSTVSSIENPFFFKNDISQMNYKGKFLFNTDEFIEKDTVLHINEIINLENGKVYELKLDSTNDIPNERLNLGYFYVQQDKIYKIEHNQENLNKLKEGEEIPDNSVIVCQEKELKDELNENERGWHHYVKVNGDIREYHAYNNLTSTGYYETFIWEKDKGLIQYRSGYGAERDSIELNLINDQKESEASQVQKNSTQVNSFNYINDKFKFSLEFPESWKGKYFITENEFGIIVNYNTEVGKEKNIWFFGIGVKKASEWLENGGDFTEKICEQNGLVYYAIFPTQANFDMNLENEKTEAEEFMNLNNGSINIIKSLKVIE